MKLITIDEYKRRQFTEQSAPHDSTIRRWIASGQLSGRIIGGTYYVCEHELKSSGNELVDKVLRVG